MAHRLEPTVTAQHPGMVQLTDSDAAPDWLRQRTFGPERYAVLGHGAKADERALWAAIQAPGVTPRDVAPFLLIHPKRVRYLCEKWADRGLYQWGTVHDLGWVIRP